MSNAVAAPSRKEWWRRNGALLLVPVFLFVALIAWAASSPIGSSPDEDFHLNSVWCGLGERPGLCEAGPTPNERDTPFVLSHIACYSGQLTQTGACQWLWDRTMTPTSRLNVTGIYPPLFYAAMSVFADTDHIVRSVLLMRLVNVLLFLGLGAALYALLPPPRRFTMVMSWVVTIVPLTAFLIAAVNPSSWAIAGCGTAWLAALGFFESTGRRRVGLAIVTLIATIMAAGSRGDAAIYCVIGVGVAVVIGLTRRGRFWRPRTLWLPIVVLVLGVVGLLSAQQSRAVIGATRLALGLGSGTGGASIGSDHVALASVVTAAATPGDNGGIGLLFRNAIQLPYLWTGALGSGPLGWLDTPMPALVAAVGTFAFGAIVFLGLRHLDWRKTTAIVALAVLLIVIPLYELQIAGRLVGNSVQPRYLLPLLIVLAGVATLPVAGKTLSLTPLQRNVLIVCIAVSNCAALYANMARYVHIETAQTFDLNHFIAWWWGALIPSPMAVWAIGSLAFAAALAIAVVRTPAVPFAADVAAAEEPRQEAHLTR
ncbi:DUF2142 domain-containing protein [Gryllotalpicola reticulitermitis]|uniref:DUF2142 domain-containing protein n=1 Tax=Gryllotalpicola reticulitermitis TaxID=1184153 RepID=A0ABV8Q5D0_9MICO